MKIINFLFSNINKKYFLISLNIINGIVTIQIELKNDERFLYKFTNRGLLNSLSL